MTKAELLAYVTQAKDLEVTCYTNATLKEEYPKKAAEKHPTAPEVPVKKRITKPEKPVDPDCRTGTVGGIVCTIIGFIILILACVGGFRLSLFAMSCFVLAVGILLLLGVPSDKKEFFKAQDEYSSALEKYEKEASIAEAEYQAALAAYNQSMEACTAETERQLSLQKEHCEKLNKVQGELEKSLEKLYAQNVIFPKYRNLVAVSAIYEYLSSGRCEQLDGADGAYNLYETELRQDIVIGQLSTILGNLEQIKNNQFTLYNEMISANSKVKQTLETIAADASMTAYYAEMAAKAASADRMIVGMTL